MQPSTTSIEYAEDGWTPLSDGSYGQIRPNGQVLSGHGGVSEFTDSDGTVVREKPEDQRHKAEKHKSAVLAFKAHVTAERLMRVRRVPAPAARPTRPGRVTIVRRARTTTTAAPTRGSPDDDPDEPGEQTWALTFVDRAPVFWRLRDARCRLLEMREAIRMGVDR